MRLRPIALLAALGLAGCAGPKVKPTGAGSTAALRLMRDWRGLWSGAVKDSPMGQLPYALAIEEVDGRKLRVRMTPQRDGDLDNMRHAYELSDFAAGMPSIHYVLEQRNTRQEGEVSYREDLSTDSEAVFCPAEAGCDRVKLSVEMESQTRVLLRAMVREAPHATIELEFASREVPGDAFQQAPKSILRRSRMKPADGQSESE